MLKNVLSIPKICLYRWWDFIFACNTHIPCIYPYHHALQDVYKPPGNSLGVTSSASMYLSASRSHDAVKSMQFVPDTDLICCLINLSCTFEWFLVYEKWKLDFIWERHCKRSPYSYYPCTIPHSSFLNRFVRVSTRLESLNQNSKTVASEISASRTSVFII